MNEKYPKQSEALVIINPVAGVMNASLMERIILEHFKKAGWKTTLLYTEKDTNMGVLLGDYLAKEIDLVVVAGGDGTVASVAAGMVNSKIPLGIVPSGTWNAIARYLMLPANPWRALALITGRHRVRYLDLMSIGNQLHALNISIGMSANMIKTSSREQKRKFGNLVYFSNWFKQMTGMKLIRYVIEADGVKYRGRAAEIMVANYGVVGLNLIEAPLEIHPDDGKADVLIFRPKTVFDVPAMLWQALIKRQKRAPKFRQLQASKTITIKTRIPMDVQADGELIGQTPISVNVLARCVGVVVP